MNYTFQKRKELNEAFMRKYASVPVEYQREGVPFVHTRGVPAMATRVGNVRELKDLLPETIETKVWKVTLPVLYKIKHLTPDGTFEDLYEISYVNATARSLAQAAEKIEKDNLWMFPELIRL